MTELEKLKWAAAQLEQLTDGRLAFQASGDAWIIAQPEDSCLWVSFDRMSQGDYSFHVWCSLPMLHGWVSSAKLGRLAADSPIIYPAIAEVEKHTYTPSKEDFAAFQKFLAVRQEQTAQPGSVLGPTI